MTTLRTREVMHRLDVRFAGTAERWGGHVFMREVTVPSVETDYDVLVERHGVERADQIMRAGWYRDRDWTKPGRDRRIDALAVSCKGATFGEVHGIEVKVTRADWLRELKDGRKADAGAALCHRWWLAVGDKTIVKAGELPDGWGLLVPHGRGLRVDVHPTARTPDVTPAWMARLVLAAQRSHRHCRRFARIEGYGDGYRVGLDSSSWRIARAEREAYERGVADGIAAERRDAAACVPWTHEGAADARA